MLVRFPAVPRDPFWSDDQAGATRALAAIEKWRASWIAWLGGERDDGISSRLATTLLEVLGALPSEGYRAYPYRLGRYPARPTLDTVLLWRAGVVDFLSDVWDTLGDSDFGIEECQRVASMLLPEGIDGANVCALCMSPYSSDPAARSRHFDVCAVQRSWSKSAP